MQRAEKWKQRSGSFLESGPSIWLFVCHCLCSSGVSDTSNFGALLGLHKIVAPAVAPRIRSISWRHPDKSPRQRARWQLEDFNFLERRQILVQDALLVSRVSVHLRLVAAARTRL